jgi:hypothetical protein
MWVTAFITWPLGKLLDFALGHADPVMKRGELRAMVQLHGESAGAGVCLSGGRMWAKPADAEAPLCC